MTRRYNTKGLPKKYKPKICDVCELPFDPGSGSATTCPDWECQKEHARRRTEKRKLTRKRVGKGSDKVKVERSYGKAGIMRRYEQENQ